MSSFIIFFQLRLFKLAVYVCKNWQSYVCVLGAKLTLGPVLHATMVALYPSLNYFFLQANEVLLQGSYQKCASENLSRFLFFVVFY